MKFRFQSFVDISTSASSMQVIQWSVGGVEVLNRCRHLFGAYKYFKLGKISIKMVPASTLPVDPLGLSYGDSDPQTVDPRDQMNPGLVRITNGEDIYTNISAMSADQQMNAYNAMMLDPRWSKFMLQSGFRRSAYPLYWQVGQLSQDKYPGTVFNAPVLSADGTGFFSASHTEAVYERVRGNDTASSDSSVLRLQRGSSARGLFQVGHRGKLGFLPTDYYQQILGTGDNNSSSNKIDTYGLNNVPEVSVVTCVLPKAYKTIYYYRVFITEEVIFTGLRSAPMVSDAGYNLGLDQFVIGNPIQRLPNQNPSATILDKDFNNGGMLP